MNISKKTWISLLLIVVIAMVSFFLIRAALRRDLRSEKSAGKTFYITNDIHYLSDSLNDHGAAFQKYISSGDGKQLEYIDEIFDAFADRIKKDKPDFLIISGDLTNNGEKASHTELAEKLKKLEESGTSVYVIPGNHDILNPWARGFKKDKQFVADSISADEFREIYSDFGYDEAISRDTGTLSYLAAPASDLWLLMLDTARYQDNVSLGMPEADGIITKATLDWIKKCCDLAKEEGASVVAVMHHNVLNHSELIQSGYTLNNSGQVLINLKEDHINLVLSGHIHAQDISSDQASPGLLYDIATEALSVYPHQFGILKVIDGNGNLDYSTSKTDIEGWAKLTQAADENLLHFDGYSRDYFGKLAYDRAFKRILDETDYPSDKIKLMADTMKLLNMRFFSGTENLNTGDIVSSEGYQLLTSDESPQKDYVLSVTQDKDTDDNHLRLKLPDLK